MADGELILIAGALLAGGMLASLVAGRLRVPGLLLFLFLGMGIGSDGLGWLDFDDYALARRIGIIALALILFEGGLTSGLLEIRPVLAPALSLAVIGTIVTAVVTGLAAALLFDLSTLDGMLLGSVLAATDGAAIFALLRGSTLKRRLATSLEGESGFNDPVAVLLVLGFIEWLTQDSYGIGDIAVLLVRQLGIGLGIGVVVGVAAVWVLRRVRLATGGLYPVATLAVAALAFGGADALHGSGFLAVYLAGLALGTAGVPAQQTVTAFHQGLAWVAQVTMFVALGLLVFPSRLDDVALRGTVLALVLVFLARPLAVAVATLPARFSWPERAVLAAAGLRGAVPVVLATFPVLAGVGGSFQLFDVVFFAVLLSTLIQGTTFEPAARLLGATTTEPAMPRPLAEAGTIRRLGAEILEYPIGDDDAVVGARVRDLGLPREAVVNVIVRGDEAIPPRGSTILRAGDRLHVLLRSELSRDVHRIVDRWRSGPVGPSPRLRTCPSSLQRALRPGGQLSGAANRTAMRNRQLHGAMAAFAEEAAWQLAAETADGAEVEFEIVRGGRRDSPLYCYRPLTADFIEQRVGLLTRLESFLPAVHALTGLSGLDRYLDARGERGHPVETRSRAEFALRVFLSRVFEESTDFALSEERLQRAYGELEAAVYEGRTDTVVIAPVLGLEVVADAVALGDGLTLVRGDAFPEDAPADALWAPGADRAHLLAVLRWEAAAGDASPVAHGRVRLRRLLSALRLYDTTPVAYGPLAWTRTGSSPWQPFALGALGRRGEHALVVGPEHEDELRAFCSLIARRTPRAGELAWALRRYEMACERVVPAEALTDVLLALRALLEPEGPTSGRLAGRLAALCALPEGRAALTARVAQTVALERAVVAGLSVDPELDALAAELMDHLRALLRDVLCGHLDSALTAVADEIIGEDAGVASPTLA